MAKYILGNHYPSNKPENIMKTKLQGKGIVKALGQKSTTGNFKNIEAAKGKGAAIGALQNKLAKRRGEKAPYGFSKKNSGSQMLARSLKSKSK